MIVSLCSRRSGNTQRCYFSRWKMLNLGSIIAVRQLQLEEFSRHVTHLQRLVCKAWVLHQSSALTSSFGLIMLAAIDPGLLLQKIILLALIYSAIKVHLRVKKPMLGSVGKTTLIVVRDDGLQDNEGHSLLCLSAECPQCVSSRHTVESLGFRRSRRSLIPTAVKLLQSIIRIISVCVSN